MAERKKQALARGLDDIFGADVSGLLEDIQSNRDVLIAYLGEDDE